MLTLDLNFTKKMLISSILCLPSFAFANVAQKGLADNPTICQTLSQRMRQVGDKTPIDTMHHINDDLKQCVKSASNKQNLLWLNQHTQMYDKFTTLPDSKTNSDESENLYVLAEYYYQHDKANPKDYNTLSPRAKYLAGLLGNSEIILYNEGEGFYHFWYKLTTTVDIFAPYLPENQAVYLKRIAKESQDAFFMDAGITWSYDELIDSVFFWENFIKKYPNSQMLNDAKFLYIANQYYLFSGSENTRWANDDITEMYEKKDLASLQKVAKTPNSSFANHARTYLAFLHMSQAERDKHYPINKLDENDAPKRSSQIADEQLKKALQPLVDDFENQRANFDNCIDFGNICNANNTTKKAN